ncbi:restriction endonuclease subunit S [Clostridium perfringens]|uniref:restriction endonuclease subunit S n=1 Tax=Clostridium perfringens TaxID=1502 RepID=UPI002900D93E|nr:restriction endonuclease subunit S [Clostridium perfringens]MDM0722646.1 restriction endonuclease subunit S [Clostridium perfringens]MDM0725710.1 restriction endonuclease subunit S [Clostridium perfringens]MDM0925250.1 restriction endonuclease subunit S [Clostridium perfringens]MDM0978552.1 restriction endonuclease subunit S [Clostridium perfringens]
MKKEAREGYKMTELGEIPNEWSIKKIGDLIHYMKSGLSRNLKEDDIGIPCIRSNNIINSKICGDELKYWYLEDDKGANIRDYILNDGDILINFINSMSQIGKGCIYKDIGRPAIYTTNIFRMQMEKKVMNNLYFNYFIQTEFYKKEIVLITKPAINQASFTTGDFKNIKLVVPTIKEQEKIVEILSTVDEQIENTEKLIQKNQELKKGLMQQLLTKGIGHTEFKKTELGIIPKKWRLKKIDEIGKVITGNTPKTTEKDNYGDEFLWVSPFDMGSSKYIKNTNKMLSKKGFDKARKLPSGAVLVTCIGSTIGKIGIATNELSTNQQINSIICNEDVDSEFIYYAIDYNFSKYSNYISNQAVPIINKSTFGEFLIQIPELKEQNKVAKILSKVDDDIEKQLNKKNKLEILRNGLIQQLLTGNIRVI